MMHNAVMIPERKWRNGPAPLAVNLSRREIEDAIELLIAWLDATDGDADHEEDDPDVCQAGDDGCAPFMTFYGPRWGADVAEPASWAFMEDVR